MLITRRSFLASSALAAAGLALPARRALARADDDLLFEWKPVHDKVKAAFGFGGNAMLVMGKGACLLVDAKNAPFGKQLRRESEAAGGQILALVNTHHHADHTGGNHAFTKDIEVIAHDNASPRIRQQTNRYLSQMKEGVKELAEAKPKPAEKVKDDLKQFVGHMTEVKPALFVPTATFSTDRTLDVGGVKVVLKHFGKGHTDNDAVVHLPDLNILHTGDLLFHKVYPYVDPDGGGNTKSWQETLTKVLALCDDKTKIVPGHGDLCTKQALADQIEYFDKMRDWVAKQIKAGKTRKEIVESNPEPYNTYNVPWIRPITLAGIHDELKAEMGEKK